MVKLSQKSKRIPCKKRYKIEKRIRQHNKKVKKDKEVKDSKKSHRSKAIRVPGKHPFKEEILVAAEKQKQANLEAKKQKKLERRKNLLTNSKQNEFKDIEDMLKQAEKKQEQFNRNLNLLGKENPFDGFGLAKSTEKETSLKAFYKEFKKVVEAADVIIQVLDARDPIGSRCPQVEDMVINSGQNKKLVLLLNKIDLVPKSNVQEWLKYLRSQYPTVAFKASTQSQNERLSQSSVPVDQANSNLLTSSKCLGADLLVKLLNNYTRINDVKQTITVGIIGLPNVGKSSIINSLKRSHACQIGSVPGLTRCMQEIKLDKHIKLLDSPGIVMSKDEDSASLALKNCIRIESLEDPVAPVDLLLKRCSKDQLIMRYKISDYSDVTDFLNQVAKRCGKVKKTGIPDIRKAAQHILNDWISGRLTYYTQPPATEKPSETKIVTELAPAFDIDALLKEEETMMDGIDDTKVIVEGIEIKPNEPVKVNFETFEKEETVELESENENEDDIQKRMTENAVYKTDVILNPKVNRKIKAQMLPDESVEVKDGKPKLKRKSAEMSDSEDAIYETEDIPRTKKMQKLEMKKKLKKQRKNEKLFNNLGDVLNQVKISSDGKNDKVYDFKTDFNI
ncbi:guanine nucleotide-binding -like 3 -like protein [Brachionus plicatilis]|uniref:Guanine nucleotide-binding-like 3-like protein n=1 Tax=Brachionus plicatilis TaxID=10195 RepID=A0A3M7QZ93_BRAPC|nr:guanine nucleotide-binding -like 3 -like protein [Brachionus plicatilis]